MRGRDQNVDLSMNMPPQIDDPALQREMYQPLGGAGGLGWLTRYQAPGGGLEDRLQAMQWLSNKQPLENTDDLVLCNGVQGASLSILGQITSPGDTICCEELCYPGVLTLAKQMSLNVVPVTIDDRGRLVPDDAG